MVTTVVLKRKAKTSSLAKNNALQRKIAGSAKKQSHLFFLFGAA
jgi:hypothetical protein